MFTFKQYGKVYWNYRVLCLTTNHKAYICNYINNIAKHCVKQALPGCNYSYWGTNQDDRSKVLLKWLKCVFPMVFRAPHLKLRSVKYGFDWGRLCGCRQQLLEQDQWRQGVLWRQACIRGGHHFICKQRENPWDKDTLHSSSGMQPTQQGRAFNEWLKRLTISAFARFETSLFKGERVIKFLKYILVYIKRTNANWNEMYSNAV